MIGELTFAQIQQVLFSQVVGRIGCFADNKIYVVPVTFVYDGKDIYVHSKEGLKITMMRKNPNVCFEVDVMENMANWRSVIVWGRYEELKTEVAYKKGMKILSDRLSPLIISHTAQVGIDLSMAPLKVERQKKAIAYRIKINESTGKFEKN